MNLIKGAIEQPVTIAVGVILIILAGLVSLTRLPIALTPTVDNTVITVTTFWEGASPEEIEQNIIDKQEERLLGLSDLRLMTSSSGQSAGTIRLEFMTGTDKDSALREVSDKLREVPDYPENADEPYIDATDAENRDYIAWIVFGTTDPDCDIRTLRDFAVDRIEPYLENVKGVAEINVLGGRERELQIRVDPVRLARHGITPTQFAQIIRDTNQNLSAGQVADGKRDIRVRTIGQYESTEAIEQTVIERNERGTVLVKDVADVVLTYKEAGGFVRSKGKSVIAINADRELGSNVIEVMAELKKAVAELNMEGGILETEARRLGLNGELTLTQVFDQTVYIDDAINLVQSNIWIGGGLAILVLIIFLRTVRSVGIIALAIPISVVGAVVAMVAMGRSINVISLAGMAFAVGMVVDNAIVVLENIFRHLEMGKPPRKAALDGTREVWGAVLASTLTTVAVFIPILLVQEEAGQLFRDIALAICAAVSLSLIVSVTVIPTVGARVLRSRKKKTKTKTSIFNWPSRIPYWIGAVIYGICGSVVLRLIIVTLLTAASLFGTWKLMPPADYLPTGNRNLVFGFIIPPPGYNLDQYVDMAERVEQTIAPYWEPGVTEEVGSPEYNEAVTSMPMIPMYIPFVGEVGPPFTPPPLENYFIVKFGGILFHGGISADPARAKDMIPLFAYAARPDAIPGVFAFPMQVPLFQLGGSTGSAIKVQLAGPDLDEIIQTGVAVFGNLSQSEQFAQVQPSPSNFYIPSPEVHIKPDLLRLGELGLTTADIGLAVRASGDGAIIDEYRMGGEAIDLKVIDRNAVDRDHITNFVDIPIATPSGHTVTLGSIAEIQPANRPQEIARVRRERAVTFEISPRPDVALEAAIAEIESRFKTMREQGIIPPSISTSMAGTAGKLNEVRSALLGDGTWLGLLGSSLTLALLVVYLLMCVLFQSFLKPLVIMFSVPLATLGGFGALAAVAAWSMSDPYMPIQKLDVLTMLGFVILIGIVVNNAILIVHQALNFMRGVADDDEHTNPLPARRAIAEAVRTRVRPIFMGTLTSIGGMAPLVLMPGAGSELYRGLGSVVLGGLLVSTVFTIVLVPLLLSLVMDVQNLFSRSSAPAGAAPTTTATIGAARSPGHDD